MNACTRAVAGLAAAVGVGLVVGPGTGVARAEESLISLSSDGVTWADALPEPLFDPAIRWVPGDVRAARFYLRNESDGDGDVVVDVESGSHDALRRSGSLLVSARSADGPWLTVRGDELHEVLDSRDLVPGRAVPVEVRVAMDDAAPNGTMVLAADLDLVVTVTEARVKGDEGSRGDDDEGTDAGDTATDVDLPQTGAVVAVWQLVLALASTALGLLLVTRRRRDDEPRPTDLHPTPTSQEQS